VIRGFSKESSRVLLLSFASGLSISLSLPFSSFAQTKNLPTNLNFGSLIKDIVDRNTNVSARESQLQAVREKVTAENFDFNLHPLHLFKDLDRNNRDRWLDLLWKTAVLEPQKPYIVESLAQILQFAIPAPNQSDRAIQPEVITAALRLAIQLHNSKAEIYQGLKANLVQVANRSENSTWAAMALSGLGQKDDSLTSSLAQRFDLNAPANLSLATTLQSLPTPNQTQPPFRDLLLANIVPKQPILFVVCASDRSLLCQVIVKDDRGRFLKDANGKLWSVPLFLQSLHRLPWNFTNGNTPQGIYRIEGLEPESLKTAKDLPSDREFLAYGQFPLVKLFMPFEAQVKEFLPGKKGAFKDNIQAYQALLPSSWRNYFPLQQSYWAGKLGRSFIRIHGTGFAPGYFWTSQAITNPNWNPALGCLSAQEIYDSQGNLIQADMPKILDALRQVGKGKVTGYAVVVDLGTNQDPSTEINRALN
jgi:hypothetical protein